MRTPRNPRRSYRSDGTEIAPATLGNIRENGNRTVQASCESCQHMTVVNVDGLGDEVFVPDVALKLRCSACGSKRIVTRLNMVEHQAIGLR